MSGMLLANKGSHRRNQGSVTSSRPYSRPYSRSRSRSRRRRSSQKRNPPSRLTRHQWSSHAGGHFSDSLTMNWSNPLRTPGSGPQRHTTWCPNSHRRNSISSSRRQRHCPRHLKSRARTRKTGFVSVQSMVFETVCTGLCPFLLSLFVCSCFVYLSPFVQRSLDLRFISASVAHVKCLLISRSCQLKAK